MRSNAVKKKIVARVFFEKTGKLTKSSDADFAENVFRWQRFMLQNNNAMRAVYTSDESNDCGKTGIK